MRDDDRAAVTVALHDIQKNDAPGAVTAGLLSVLRSLIFMIAVLGWGLIGLASAAIVDQPMTGSTAPGWVFGGSAVLTGDGTTDPAGDGWLRLTTNAGNQGGFAFYDTAFDISQGVVIQFDYATWGGTGADGYSIFLFDGAITPATFQLGGVGGSLGYAQRNIVPTSTGLNGGFIGVGVDEWGNYQNPTEGRIGGPGFRPNSLAVRGPQSNNYSYIGGTIANVGTLWFNQPTRPLQVSNQYRKVVIYLTPVPAPNYLRIDVFLQYGYNQPLTQVLNGLMVGQPVPASVKVGYAASTGGSTNYHEIRNLLINPLSTDINLAIFKTASASTIAVGSPLTYTLTARNYGPNMVTATNAPLSDVVPAQLTGVTWTCAGSGGAVCGAASGSGNNVSTTATLPFNSSAVYTITGTLTTAPPSSTLSNTATIGVPAGVTDYNLDDNTSTVNVLVSNDLSTSAKTVLDLSGGDADPGDVLRYTITLNETAGGNATGISVTDDIPTNVTNFTVVNAGGGTNSSTGAGTGANGTGYLNITNISIPANGSVSIVFEVTIAGGTSAGTLINNTATVTNPGGTGAVPIAPTIVVSQSALAQKGNKHLYVYGAGGGAAGPISRLAAGNTANITIGNGAVVSWTQDVPLQLPLTLDPAGADVPVYLWLSNTSLNRTRNLTVSLTCGAVSLTQTKAITLTTTPTLQTFNLPYTGTQTCAQGNSWVLTINNNNFNRVLTAYPVSGGNPSYVYLPSTNVINVDSVDIYDAGGSPIVTTPTGTTVTIRSVISDPFGSFDITSASIIITDPTGSVRVNGAAMTQVADSGTSTKTYEYIYAVPAGGPAGNWTMRVVGAEGTEGTISDLAQTALNVFIPLPNILVVKSVQPYSDPMNGTTSPKAIPGAVMEYTVIVTNSGPGPVDNNTTVLTDAVPANMTMYVDTGSGDPVTFSCSSSPGCGLTFNYGANVRYTDTFPLPALLAPPNVCGNFTYTPAGSYDGNVRGICINPAGILNGSTGPPDPQFTIKYRMRLN